jgi:hypothetical protein
MYSERERGDADCWGIRGAREYTVDAVDTGYIYIYKNNKTEFFS